MTGSMSSSEKSSSIHTVHFRGSCACDRISYDCTSLLGKDGSTVCHCVTCQKPSGGPFQAFTSAPSKQVMWYDKIAKLRYEGLPTDTLGGIKLLRLSDIADRAACLSCGSWLAMRYHRRCDQTYLTLGCVDQQSVATEDVAARLKAGEEIFCHAKVRWIGLDGNDRRHLDRLPPAFEAAVKS